MADPAGWQNGVFGLPAGVDFAAEFVRGLLDRMAGKPPEALAAVTVYSNAAPTLTAIRDAFDRTGRALLLPRLALVTDLAPPDAPPAVPPLPRRLALARLVAGLIGARPDLGRGQSIPRLAGALADLMAEMQAEGLGPDALDRIDPAEHARHWQHAHAFLRIAAEFALTGPPVDRAARQRAAAEAMAADWAAGRRLPAGPVIVAGSTGSHGATRRFMQAVAQRPQGAVVVPGWDFDLPAAVWNDLDAPDRQDHPQARLAPLRAAAPGPVRPWTDATAPDPGRARLLSLALRPAPVTDRWIAEGPGLGPDLRPVTAGLTLIEAPGPAEEAGAIAAILRAAIAASRPVTLIAADRTLLRRVRAALDRWHVIPDDAAGRPLPLTPPGLLLRMLAALPGQPMTAATLVALLKHPLASTGSTALPAPEARLAARRLELRLRRHGPAFPDGAAIRAWGAHPKTQAPPGFADWLAGWLDAAVPLAADRTPRPIAERVAALRALAEALAAGPGGDPATSQLWQGEAGAAALAVLDQLGRHADAGPPLGADDFADLLLAEMDGRTLRAGIEAHPLIRFAGPREARVAAHGTVILAGLIEGGWPAATPPDPFLSRPMRLAAGLTLPERRTGLAAHDWQIGMGARQVILTRARRDATAETVPARWLNRLTALLDGLPDQHGRAALAAMRARGAAWLAVAARIAAPDALVPAAPRPAPIPPPRSFDTLPVTDIRILIRDPYAIYARRVLGLAELNPLRADPDFRERGTVLHAVMQAYAPALRDDAPDPDRLRAALMAAAEGVIADMVPWPLSRRLWLARIARIADRLVAGDIARLAVARPVLVEKTVKLRNADGFLLTARPDRIDATPDGSAVFVYDYKTTVPGPTAIAREEKQLPLTAAILARGGSPDLGPMDAVTAAYVSLASGETKAVALDDPAQEWARMGELVAAYRQGGAGFVAALADPDAETGRFAGLSRLGEWSLADPPVPVGVGDPADG